MNANGQLLETLTHSEMFKNYERAYTEATGLPVTMRPVETWQLPLYGQRHENPRSARAVREPESLGAHVFNPHFAALKPALRGRHLHAHPSAGGRCRCAGR